MSTRHAWRLRDDFQVDCGFHGHHGASRTFLSIFLEPVNFGGVKVCSYCGHENNDDQQVCAGCGSDLPKEHTPQPEPARETSRPFAMTDTGLRPTLLSAGFFENAEPLDVSKIDMGFSFQEGFSWPDWKCIRESIQKSFPKEQWAQAWREAGIQWLTELKENLGGDYQEYESWNFLLLSAEGAENSENILNMSEEIVDTIESGLKLSIKRELYGKRVILAFNEEDDYYSYVSHFHPDGHFSASPGMFIKGGGYAHVAFSFVGMQHVRRLLVHELTHNCLMGLRIPQWLNEGLSVRIEKGLTRRATAGSFGTAPIILDRELAAQHHAFWNEKNIQDFWAGTSYYKPGEINKLSYNLGEILVELLAVNWADFLNFVQNADPRDAGQDAALKCLNCCLGDTLSRFLGPGQWRPNRKTIAELWQRK